MGRAPSTFRETNVKGAVRAVEAAGKSVRGVRFENDGFTVLTDPVKDNNGNDDNSNNDDNDSTNPWDEVDLK
jgi:hypothetical protein